MATIALLVGGAIVNALAFSGSNYLFSTLRSDETAKEQKRHDLATEQTQEAQVAWSKRQNERLNWINEQLRRENYAAKTFDDVEEAEREYYIATGRTLPPDPYPQLSDFYTPSNDQKERELIFVALGMAAVGFAAYEIYNYEKGN